MNENLSERARQDWELIELAVKSKDQKAYADLLDRYWNNVFFLLMKMVNDRDIAEDLTIETFGKAFQRLENYEPEFAFSTWLLKIASNNGIDFIRKKKLSMFSIDQPITTAEGELVQPDYEADVPNPEEEFIRDQKIEILRSLVEKVKPMRYRQLIDLRYFREFTYEEIATEMQMPLGTVKAQLFRARELLMEVIKKTKTKGNL